MVSMVILDRDGVINHDSDHYIKSVDEWVPIDGSLEAIARLSAAGYLVAVATNQSGLARGYFDRATLDAMHAKLRRLLADHGGRIDGIAFCPHLPVEQCDCRKPRPGLLRQIAEQFALDLADCVFVGDSFKDVEAARAVGARPVLVKTGKGLRTLAEHAPIDGVAIYADLAAFVDDFLGSKTQ